MFRTATASLSRNESYLAGRSEHFYSHAWNDLEDDHGKDDHGKDDVSSNRESEEIENFRNSYVFSPHFAGLLAPPGGTWSRHSHLAVPTIKSAVYMHNGPTCKIVVESVYCVGARKALTTS